MFHVVELTKRLDTSGVCKLYYFIKPIVMYLYFTNSYYNGKTAVTLNSDFTVYVAQLNIILSPKSLFDCINTLSTKTHVYSKNAM